MSENQNMFVSQPPVIQHTLPVDVELQTVWLIVSVHQTEDVFKEAAAVHVVVLCLLRGLALLPPPEPQQLLLCRSSVSLWSRDAQEVILWYWQTLLYVKFCTAVDVWVLVTFSQEPCVRRPAALPASHSAAAHHPLSQTTSCVWPMTLEMSCCCGCCAACPSVVHQRLKRRRIRHRGREVVSLLSGLWSFHRLSSALHVK